jgi:cytochrome c oxidase cbb3-type subunit 4
MYKDILRAIVGIEIFPVLSLLIFLLVFLVMLAWVMGMDRRTLADHARLPLHDDEQEPLVNSSPAGPHRGCA